MIAASTYLPSASSSTIAASSIHGTGAQNFSSARRNGCSVVSGIAFGPNFASRRRASSLVRPLNSPTWVALADLAGGALTSDSPVAIVVVIWSGSPYRRFARPDVSCARRTQTRSERGPTTGPKSSSLA